MPGRGQAVLASDFFAASVELFDSFVDDDESLDDDEESLDEESLDDESRLDEALRDDDDARASVL